MIDEVMDTFVEESRELLEDMEQALLRIEQMPHDPDTINAIFRAAHTIKGSAGLFGLDDIVSFTHVAESVLVQVRDADLVMHGELVALFLKVKDHLSAMIEYVALRQEPASSMHQTGQELITQLNTFLGPKSPVVSVLSSPIPAEQTSTIELDGGGEVETDLWHLSLRFGRDVLKNGMDPLSFIRYLSTLGNIHRLVTLLDSIPPFAEMDPESCYLGFEISLKSDADKATIEGVFDFVREDSLIRILPPRSKIAEYLQLIDDLPEEDIRVGEMLVRCGTLTEAELAAALKMQHGDGAKRTLGEVLVETQMVQSSVIQAALDKQKQVKESKNSEAQLIRVNADKLDRLINLVGELVIAGAGASLMARHTTLGATRFDDPAGAAANLIAKRTGMADMIEATSTMARLVEEVRDTALNLRMVEIGGTFNRFKRVVRDISKELGKDVELIIGGAETELDRTVVEKIGDPLTHLVRNALDHGIEPPDVRLARGKPAKGTVWLNAYHDASSIVIEVSDDGGGLNKEKILAKAIQRGLVKPDQYLTDGEIHNLIFEAGFSTADAVSNLSGRGVGMDVVLRNIKTLRGTIHLDSTEGIGSIVRIRLPLTLAIIDGFLVGVGDAAYVIPLDMVVECIELNGMENNNGDGRYLNLRGEVLPYQRLREHFEVEGEPARRENVVVVKYGQHKAGLVVDKLMGEFQTVIKPLGKIFNQIRGIGGFTILASGEVALILDVPGLMKRIAAQGKNSSVLPASASLGEDTVLK